MVISMVQSQGLPKHNASRVRAIDRQRLLLSSPDAEIRGLFICGCAWHNWSRKGAKIKQRVPIFWREIEWAQGPSMLIQRRSSEVLAHEKPAWIITLIESDTSLPEMFFIDFSWALLNSWVLLNSRSKTLNALHFWLDLKLLVKTTYARSSLADLIAAIGSWLRSSKRQFCANEVKVEANAYLLCNKILVLLNHWHAR
jgi:hypothetical protein